VHVAEARPDKKKDVSVHIPVMLVLRLSIAW
jgi:hypothetical protein